MPRRTVCVMTILLAGLVLAGCEMNTSGGSSADSSDSAGYRKDHPTAGKIDISPQSMETAAASGSPFIGQPAPAFTLADQNGQAVSLNSLRGQWVVLYFYPKDDTPGCACQATEFTQLLTEFDRRNAAIYGVSPDSPADHRKFIRKYNLEIDLLSDPRHKTMRAYGAWAENTLGGKTYGRVIRSTFLIGPDGRVRYHWPEVIPEGHAERVKAKLEELRSS